MTASELRIGNITSMGVVCSIEDNFFRVLDSEGDTFKNTWADIQPIPLTEEWLFKFGFITWDSKQIYNEWYLNFDGVLKYKIFHSKYTGVETFTMPHGDKPIKLKSVHQLQNLYFALTGEELTIKQQEQ
jgi:hypothetical protein